MGLILRTSIAANTNAGLVRKGSALSYLEGDGNFVYLLTNMSGSTISISGTTTLTGSLYVTNGISGSLTGTASYATSASHAITASFALSVSGTITNAQTASFITSSGVYGPYGSNSILSSSYASGSTSASYALTASYALFVSGSTPNSLTASFVTASNVWGIFGSNSILSASYASSSLSASYALTSSHAVTASIALKVLGNITSADTASYVTGSIFTSANPALSASYAANASNALNADSATSATTATYAVTAGSTTNSTNAQTASYITSSGVYGPNGSNSILSSSYAITASFALSVSGSITNAITASYITASGVYGPFGTSSIASASYASGSTSASYAISSSNALTASFALSVSGSITNAITASYITSSGVYGPYGLNSIASASYASGSTSSSYALSASYAVSASNVVSASYAISASNVISASYAISASNVISASYAISASNVISASYAISSSNSLTASYALNASNANTGSLLTTASIVSNSNVIRFTKGDTTTFDITVNTGSVTVTPVGVITTGSIGTTQSITGSLVLSGSSLTITGSLNISGTLNATASWAVSASQAISASYAISSSNTISASYALSASRAITASHALNALNAITTAVLQSTNQIQFTQVDGDTSNVSLTTITQGPGVTVNATTSPVGYAITASVRTVNGNSPDTITGNVATSLTATRTGLSASLQASSSGANTGSLADGTVWIISGEVAPSASLNGDTYIWSSGSHAWYYIPKLDTAAGDARWLQLAGGTMTGNITLNSGIKVLGTASYADSASYSISSSSAISSSRAISSSYAISASNTINSQTASFLPVATYQITSSWAVSASQAISSSYATTASYALNGGGTTNNFYNTASFIATGSVTASVDIGNATFKIVSASNTVFVITGSDNRVGIGGITSPNSTLHVSGTFRVTTGNSNSGRGQLIVDPTDAVFIGPSSGNSAAKLVITGGTSAGGYIWFGYNGTYSGEIQSDNPGRININPASESVFMIAGAEVARINNNRNLLIGTTINDGRLTVSGSTVLSGSLTTTGSVAFKSLTSTSQVNVVTIDTSTGQLYYTASSALGGGNTTNNFYNTASFIATGSVTASVNVGTGNIFTVSSASANLMTISSTRGNTTINTGSLTLSSPTGSDNQGAIINLGDGIANALVLKGYGQGGNRYSVIGTNTGETSRYSASFQGGGIYFDDRNNVPPVRLMYQSSGSANAIGAVGITAKGNTTIGYNSSVGDYEYNYRLMITGSGTSGVLNADNTLYVSGSNVGIGVATPTAKLNVSASTNQTLRISGVTASVAYNGLINITGSTFYGTPVLDYSVNGSDAVLYMRGTGDTQPLTIKSSYDNSITSVTYRSFYFYQPNTFIVSQSAGSNLPIFNAYDSAANKWFDIDATSQKGTTAYTKFTVSGSTEVTGSLTITGSTTTQGNIGINTTASSTYQLDITNKGAVGAPSKLRLGASGFGDVFTVGVGSTSQGYSDMYLVGSTYTIALYANPQASTYVNNSISYSFNSSGLIAGGNAKLVLGAGSEEKMRIDQSGNVSIGTQTQNISSSLYKLNVAGNVYISASSNTTSSLVVVGSGSLNPLFRVVGSQGELFSVTDNLTGSLFSVNDISGLPILDVNSDQTVKIGSYLSPALYATAKTTITTGTGQVIYNLPTASYDGAWYDYTIRSGSVGRAGSIIAIWSGSSVNFNEVSASSFGTSTGFVFGVIVSGSNMALTGSATTTGWTVKTIIRSI